jgi:hypothetical protein
MAPRLAVAVNLAQFVARDSHSRFSLSTIKRQFITPTHLLKWHQRSAVKQNIVLLQQTTTQAAHLKNWSLVVPECMMPLAMTVAL